MDRNKLKKLIESKRERSNHLNVQYDYLNILEEELSKTRIKRFVGTTYLIIKRFILITISLSFIIFGIITLINPNFIYKYTTIDEYIINNTQGYYKEQAGETIKETILNLAKTNSKITMNSILNSLEIGIKSAIENEILQIILGLSILLIALGLLLLYISRLTKKIRLRNKQISNAEKKIGNILIEFKNIINSEKNELQNLEDIYDHKIVGSNV